MLKSIPLSSQVRKSKQGGFIADVVRMDARGFRKIRGRCDDRNAYGYVHHCLLFGDDRMDEWSRSPRDVAATPNCIATLSRQPAGIPVRNVVGLIDLEVASDDELGSLLDQMRGFSFTGDLLARAFLVNSGTSVFWSGVPSAQLRGLSGPAFRQALLQKPPAPRRIYEAISSMLRVQLADRWRLACVCLDHDTARALAREFAAESDFDRFAAAGGLAAPTASDIKMFYLAGLPIVVASSATYADEVDVFRVRGSGAYETSMSKVYIPDANIQDVAGWNMLRSDGNDPEQTRRILLMSP